MVEECAEEEYRSGSKGFESSQLSAPISKEAKKIKQTQKFEHICDGG
jgi:hypothetical protein